MAIALIDILQMLLWVLSWIVIAQVIISWLFAFNVINPSSGFMRALVEALDLKDAVHVGHSTGGGEVARYLGRHGTKRTAKAVLISAVPPLANREFAPAPSEM